MKIASLKKYFAPAALGLALTISGTAHAQNYNSENYTINRIYQQLKDLAQSQEFRYFKDTVRGTRAFDDQRVKEAFGAMRTISSGYYDQDNGAKLALAFCVTNDISALLHMGGQRDNVLRTKMNRLHRATQFLVNNQGNVNNCPEIYSTYRPR